MLSHAVFFLLIAPSTHSSPPVYFGLFLGRQLEDGRSQHDGPTSRVPFRPRELRWGWDCEIRQVSKTMRPDRLVSRQYHDYFYHERTMRQHLQRRVRQVTD